MTEKVLIFGILKMHARILSLFNKMIIGLMNIIAHEYGEILVNRIYKIARENIPELLIDISALLTS